MKKDYIVRIVIYGAGVIGRICAAHKDKIVMRKTAQALQDTMKAKAGMEQLHRVFYGCMEGRETGLFTNLARKRPR